MSSCNECKHVYKFEQLNKGETVWPCSWCDNGDLMDTERKAPDDDYATLTTALAASQEKVEGLEAEIVDREEQYRVTGEIAAKEIHKVARLVEALELARDWAIDVSTGELAVSGGMLIFTIIRAIADSEEK